MVKIQDRHIFFKYYPKIGDQFFVDLFLFWFAKLAEQFQVHKLYKNVSQLISHTILA